MSELGRTLVILGLLLALAGALILGLNRLSIPLGRLPGDLSWRGRGWSVLVSNRYFDSDQCSSQRTSLGYGTAAALTVYLAAQRC